MILKKCCISLADGQGHVYSQELFNMTFSFRAVKDNEQMSKQEMSNVVGNQFYNEHVTMIEGSNLMTLEFAEKNSMRSKLNERIIATCRHTSNFLGGPQA